MTITEIGTSLLRNFAPEERSIPDDAAYAGRNASVVEAINGALQELFALGGPWMRKDQRGELVGARTQVTISVTNGSTAATITGGWESWMAGCAVVITGSRHDNQIRNDSASVTLMLPHDGPTGITTATVYHDCVTAAADVTGVFSPVRLDRRHLTPLPGGKHHPVRRHDRDYSFHLESIGFVDDSRVSEAAGKPAGYAVETWTPDDTTEPVTRLRLQPAPMGTHMLDYEVTLRPPVVTSIDGNTDELPIPHDHVQSVFLPIALKRLQASPFYRADAAKEGQVDMAYQRALQLAVKLNPRKRSGTRLITPYN